MYGRIDGCVNMAVAVEKCGTLDGKNVYVNKTLSLILVITDSQVKAVVFTFYYFFYNFLT